MVVGRLLSYWEGNFSGAMLNFGMVPLPAGMIDPIWLAQYFSSKGLKLLTVGFRFSKLTSQQHHQTSAWCCNTIPWLSKSPITPSTQGGSRMDPVILINGGEITPSKIGWNNPMANPFSKAQVFFFTPLKQRRVALEGPPSNHSSRRWVLLKKATHGFFGCSRFSFRGRILGKVEKNAEKKGTTLVSFGQEKSLGWCIYKVGPQPIVINGVK